MLRAYKYRLYPNDEQKNILLKLLDAVDLSIILCYLIG